MVILSLKKSTDDRMKKLASTVQPGLKGPPVSRNAIVISRNPFLWSQNVELFSEILEKFIINPPYNFTLKFLAFT